MLQLEKLDSKLASGNWTDHDARTYGGLSNTLRLCLRELGLRPPAPTVTSPLAEHFRRPPDRAPRREATQARQHAGDLREPRLFWRPASR